MHEEAIETARKLLARMHVLRDQRLALDDDGQWRFSGPLQQAELWELASKVMVPEDITGTRQFAKFVQMLARRMDGTGPLYGSECTSLCILLAHEVATRPDVRARVDAVLEHALSERTFELFEA